MAHGIVGFAGQISFGKTIAAKHLNLKREFETVAFADPLKDLFCEYFGVDRQFIEKYKRSNDPPPGFKKTIRKSLQDIGNGFRKIKDSIWIDKFTERVESINNFVSVDDVRYLNEAQCIKNLGGINILIYRPEYLNEDTADSESQLRDVIVYLKNIWENTEQEGLVSEMPPNELLQSKLDLFDLFIVNNGVTEHLLYNKIDYWIDRLIVPKIVKPFVDKKYSTLSAAA